MKFFGLLLLCSGTLSSSVSPSIFYDLDKAEDLFKKFISDYDKSYMNDEDKLMRFDIFKKNLHDINEKNKNLEEPVFGITKFVDMLPEEFNRYQGFAKGVMVKECKYTPQKFTIGTAPESFDWRDKGVVTRVKDQSRYCGSCWAFSAIGNVEGQYAIKYDELVELSEQQLVDCIGGLGCCRNRMDNAILHMKKYGSYLEKDYPYKACVNKCKYNKKTILPKANVTDCLDFTAIDEEQLKEVLYEYGPLSVAVCAQDMQFYSKGVITSCNCREINHGILLVGFGTEMGIPYWTIKNSWGTEYGDEGYVKVKRGVNSCNMVGPEGIIVTSRVV